jgi:hypothetical protein
MVAILQHGREIGRDTFHATSPDGLDPNLLDGVEHGAGALRFRRLPAVGRGIMARELQRHGIGVAAHDGGLARRQFAGWFGQTRLCAVTGADNARLVGRERNLEVRRPCHGPHAGRDGAFEGLLRGLGGGSGLAIAGSAHGALVR